MATSDTDICNLALAHLGEAPISSLAEDSKAARACALVYAQTRDAVLESHRWNFAKTRVVLSALADAPVFGWTYQYALPSDFLRVLELNEQEFNDLLTDVYEIEDGNLLTDADEANLVYMRRETDVTKFSALFVEAFALLLAARLSEPIRGATSKTEALLNEYNRVTAPLARRVDANQGRRRKGLITLNSEAIRARFDGV